MLRIIAQALACSQRLRETFAVSKRIRDRHDSFELIDSEFEKALEEGASRKTRGRRMEQKTRQLCRQVQQALNLALAGHIAGSSLDGVFVAEVSTRPGCGHLVVHVAISDDCSSNTVMKELRDRTPQLRAAVAGWISRKRVPELTFVPAVEMVLGGDEHD